MRSLIKFTCPDRAGGTGVHPEGRDGAKMRHTSAFGQHEIGKFVEPALIKEQIVIDEERRLVPVIKGCVQTLVPAARHTPVYAVREVPGVDGGHNCFEFGLQPGVMTVKKHVRTDVVFAWQHTGEQRLRICIVTDDDHADPAHTTTPSVVSSVAAFVADPCVLAPRVKADETNNAGTPARSLTHRDGTVVNQTNFITVLKTSSGDMFLMHAKSLPHSSGS